MTKWGWKPLAIEFGAPFHVLKAVCSLSSRMLSFTEARGHRVWFLAENHRSRKGWEKVARADIQMVFKSSDPRTSWDYRALSKVNASLADLERAIKYQEIAYKMVRELGPTRFFEEADTALAQYQKQRVQQ